MTTKIFIKNGFMLCIDRRTVHCFNHSLSLTITTTSYPKSYFHPSFDWALALCLFYHVRITIDVHMFFVGFDTIHWFGSIQSELLLFLNDSISGNDFHTLGHRYFKKYFLEFSDNRCQLYQYEMESLEKKKKKQWVWEKK